MIKTISFTKRYVFALSLIALLSTLAYFNLDHLIASQADNGKMINLSSRQKIFAQKIAFYSIYYKIKELEPIIKEMEESHKQLVSANMSEELKQLYFHRPVLLDKKVQTYLFHAKRFDNSRDGRSLTYLLQHSNAMLKDLDKAVNLYLLEARNNTDKLKQVEFFIFIFTLFTLFFEAIFIFMPANRRIKQDTKDLTAQKDYSNAVIESSTNAIITLDRDLRIRTYNKMAQRIFGYTKEEMLNQSAFDKIIPRQYKILHDDGVKEFLKRLNLDKIGEVGEMEAVNKNGHIFPIRISFGTSGENESIAIVANVQDITKEKLKDQLLQQQAKFAALGEMIAIIAHQWRQPLAELNFNCMYIRKKLKDNELAKDVSKNEDIIQFMSDTITNFQNFYKVTQNSTFNPIISINQALKIVESLLKLNQINLLKEIDSKITIFGNSNSLAHVVLSILQNMIDVIRNRQVQNPTVLIFLKDTKTHIVLKISDNAGGIQIEPADDIFKPFKSKKKTPSTGIGLYMSRLVIESKFKGSIDVQNIENGAEFTIKLPH
ncbi:MAG: PAS domain S-box protein [Sulfurospirillum sp.]